MRPAHFANRLPALLGVLCGVLFLPGCDWGERHDILILVRAEDPTSRAIGDYYAAAHNIPDHRVLSLRLSGGVGENQTSEATPAAARNEIKPATFDSEIRAPIEAYLVEQDPDNEISILVTTRGIPLRIGHCKSDQRHDPRDCRSTAVDAALAGLGRLNTPGELIESNTGRVRAGRLEANANPYFGDPRPFERFRRDEPNATLRFLVARLSGPATLDDSGSKVPIALRRLIDGTLNPVSESASDSKGPNDRVWQIIASAPARSRDPASRALIDPIHALEARSGVRICDRCVNSSKSRPPIGLILQPAFPGNAVDTMPERLAFPGFVIALGGPADEKLPFDRSLGHWLARGALALSLHLDDPSLGGVTRPASLLRAWSEGRMAVEAHFNSVPQLGWTNVFVGDPLLTTAHPVALTRADRDDRDNDGIQNADDNCLDVANPDQRDSNGDGIGNRCDPDVNNDGRVDTSWGRIYPVDERGDLESIALTARNGPFDPDHDLDGDGVVDGRDLALAQLWLFRRPGPSGTH